jgi:hypothetical protein
MKATELNVFPIANLKDLSTRYRSYRVRGLQRESLDYYKNRNRLVGGLSFQIKAPVEVFERDGEHFLAVPESAPMLPSTKMLVRTSIMLDPLPDIRTLDYANRDPVTDRIAARFINTMLSRPLSNALNLWQPRTGGAFYEKREASAQAGIGRHDGFTVRAMIMEDGGIGVCVDAKSCFIDQKPVNARITRDEFQRRAKGRHAIYHFGHQWFAVNLFEISDLNCGEYRFPHDGRSMSLAEYITEESRKPIPPELANLDPAGAVLMYRNNRSQERAAPAALCYLTHDTEDLKHTHRQTIMAPSDRHAKISEIVKQYLGQVKVSGTPLQLGRRPIEMKRRLFPVPDLEFGQGKRLSARGTAGAVQAQFSDLGRTRQQMLTRHDAGFFVQSPLDRQYLVLPKSVAESWGGQFSKDLGAAVRRFYPHAQYQPEIVVYNDVGVSRNWADQAKAVMQAASDYCRHAGYAAVMIHRMAKNKRAHDQLEAVILREFPRLPASIKASVLHSSAGSEAYGQYTDPRGEPAYRIKEAARGKFTGYLRNTALSKVLLANSKWPFVLADPLHADVTVGIDVKHHTVAYAVVSQAGRSIGFHCETSQQSEKLLASQIAAHLEQILREEFAAHGKSIRSVVIHRDGRAFGEECEGAAKAVEVLRADGVLTSDASLTILEISKSGPSTVRFFEVEREQGKPDRAMNPRVGTHYFSGNDAYLATTGWPFARQGTANPLHVRYVSGGLPFAACLEDVYRLSVLAWSRPEDCSRVPITIKLTDRVLGEDADEYDEDVLRFGPAAERASA